MPRHLLVALGSLPLALVTTASGCGCDSIGCFNGVVIRIDEEFDLSALPIEITTCVDDECAVELVEASQLVPGSTTPMVYEPTAATSVRAEDTVAVSVEIRSVTTDTVLLDARGTTTLVRSDGGSSCDGDCYQSGMQYDAESNTLVTRTNGASDLHVASDTT